MAGGVRVYEPPPGTTTPEIDTVQVVVEGELRERQRIAFAQPEPRHTWSTNVAGPGETVEVATLVGEPELRLTGVTLTGTADGRFRLLVDGTPVATARINWSSPNATIALPTGYPLPVGSLATVDVQNIGLDVADFEAAIHGEVTSG